MFSVITTTYNAGSSINIAAQSIRNQCRTDIEYIVIDGGSTDNTIEAINANRDVITKFISEEDDGIYDAINKGIKMASGRYIGIIGADDAYTTRTFEYIDTVVTREASDIIAGETMLIPENGEPYRRVDEPYGINSLVSGIPFCHNAMFASANTYKRVGLYDTSYRIAADAQWVHRAIEAGMRCTYIDRILVEFSLTGVSSTESSLIMNETDRTIRENFPFLSNSDARSALMAVRSWASLDNIKPLLEKYRHHGLHGSLAQAFACRLNDPLQLSDVFPDLLLPATKIRSKEVAKYPAPSQDLARNQRDCGDQTYTTTPFFTFIIPAYNASAYLAVALDSILHQPFRDLEIIVIDDGSTDGTVDIIEEYCKRDPRVRLHRQNRGRQGAARSAGLDLARGEYVWCVDADDYIQSSVLSRLYQLIQKTKVDVVLINFAFVDPDQTLRFSDRVPGNLAGKVIDPTESEDVFQSVSAWSSPPWRYVIRRHLLTEPPLRFPTGLYYEDHPFALSLILRTNRIYVDPAISYFYVQRLGSTMNSSDSRVQDFITIRRQCIDILMNANKLRRFSNVSASYIIPFDFIKYHVNQENMKIFLIRIGDDLQDHEIELIAKLGSKREIRLLELILQLRSHGEIAPLNVQEVLEENLQEFFAKQPVLLGLESTCFYDPEGPYADAGLPRVFQWMQGGEVELRPTNVRSGQFLIDIEFRNICEDQIVEIYVNRQLQSEIVIAHSRRDILHRHEIKIDTNNDPLRTLMIRCKTWPTSNKVLGLLVEKLELRDLSNATHSVTRSGNRLVVGEGSVADHVYIDVRVNPVERTYVSIGTYSQVSGRFVFERGLGSVQIGSRSSIGHGCLFICAQDGGITIGSNVMLSWDITLMDNDAHSLDPTVRENDAFDWLAGVRSGREGLFKDWSAVRSGRIAIQDGAWLGFGSTVLKNVTIGKGAVIGAKSVVSQNVPAYTVYAGNPARFIRLVPRSHWTWCELVTACQASPRFTAALEDEYLGKDKSEAFDRLMQAGDWAWLKSEIEKFAQGRQLEVLQIGIDSGVFALALATLGHRVTFYDCSDMVEENYSTIRRLAESISGHYPNISSLLKCAALPLNDIVSHSCFDLIHSRRAFWPKFGLRPLYDLVLNGLVPGGLLISDSDGLLIKTRSAVPEIFEEYLAYETNHLQDSLVSSDYPHFIRAYGSIELFSDPTLDN